jgi:hypothetical protein
MPLQLTFPAEGTGYEIGGMAIVKGAKNMQAAKLWYDWALTLKHSLGPDYAAYQAPTVSGVELSHPELMQVNLIDYDFHLGRHEQESFCGQVHQRNGKCRRSESSKRCVWFWVVQKPPRTSLYWRKYEACCYVRNPQIVFSGIIRRYREFSLISRDPVLFMSLLFSGIFIFVFVAFPIYQTISGGFVSREGAFDLTYFARYFDSYYGPNLRRIFVDTMTMGLLTATFGTLVGFIFAYATVRCQIPGKRIIHWLALLPTISPPFALALSMILLFGRNGLVTRAYLESSMYTRNERHLRYGRPGNCADHHLLFSRLPDSACYARTPQSGDGRGCRQPGRWAGCTSSAQ